MGLSDYLNTLTAQMRCKKARSLVAEEISAHILDQKEAFMADGMDEDAALKESIRQMGDPVTVGMEMDRIHRPRPDWKFLIFIAVFSVIGLFLQYEMNQLSIDYTSVDYFPRHCVYTVVGLIVMAVLYFLDYTIVGKYALRFWGLLTVYFLWAGLFAPLRNGSHGYIQLTLYLYVPVFAGLLYRYRMRGWRGLCKCLLLFVFTALLGIRCTGLYNVTAFLSLTILIMITAAVHRGWFGVPIKRTIRLLWAAVCLAPILFICLGGLAAYQYDRLMAMISMFSGRGDTTFNYVAHVAQELLSAAKPLGNSGSSIEERLPYIFTDYIFTYVVSCYGYLAGAAVVLALLGGVARIFRLSSRLTNELGWMISFGCGCVFGIETLHYILTNFGILIFAQTYLPFFSYGLRASILTYSFSGLLLSIYRYKDVVGEVRKFPEFKTKVRVKVKLEVEKEEE